MRRMNFPGRRDQRRKDAQERDEYRASLTLEERLALCDIRPGECKRERARLQRQLKERDEPKVPEKKKRAPAKSDKKAQKALKKKGQK